MCEGFETPARTKDALSNSWKHDLMNDSEFQVFFILRK